MKMASFQKEIAEKAQKLCEEINLDYLLVTRSEQGMSLVEKKVVIRPISRR